MTHADAYPESSATIPLDARCCQAVDAAGLFSRNEAVEDVPTEHLRFLLCRYLLGEVLLNTNTGERAAVLKGAADELRLYLRWCDDLGCMHEADREGLHREEAPDAATRRTEKIARFKAERALQAKVRCGRHPQVSFTASRMACAAVRGCAPPATVQVTRRWKARSASASGQRTRRCGLS